MTRFVASACLATGLSLGLPSLSSAELRHYSSRLLDAGGHESLISYGAGTDGGMFLEITLDSLGKLGDVAGPGWALARLDASGSPVWVRSVPASAEVAASPDGGVVLYGSFYGTVDFGGGPMTSLDFDVFLAKFDADGRFQWQRRFGGNQAQRATALVIDDAGNILITGSNNLTVDFGGGTIRSNGAEDAFLAKFDANAGHLWSRGFGFGGQQVGISLDVGTDRRIALVILFNGLSVDFGAGQIINVGGGDVAAAVFDENGVLAFSIHAGSRFAEGASDITFDAQGNVFLCGAMTTALDLGGGVVMPPRDRSTNGFAASYDGNGAYRWSWLIPDPAGSGAVEVGADNLGNCFMVGTNRGPITVALDDVPPSESLVVAFNTDGEPIDAIGFDPWRLRLHMNEPRDRILLGASVNGRIDFGGGPLVTNYSDVALGVMGVRQPPKVTITQFTAANASGGVRTSWSLASGEPLGNLWLSRRVDDSAEVEVLHSAPALDGEAFFLDRNAKPGRIQSYRLTVATALGDEAYSDWVYVETPPANNVLEQNAPNPFNPLTTFSYTLSMPADVSIVIYDTNGAVIARLSQGMQPAGRHNATWGGHNMSGEFVASGVYFYRLEGVPDVGARKMLLLK